MFSLVNDILPLWHGTRYSFHVTTEIPLSGTIACGFFVSTVLQHVGFNINRTGMARTASLYMIQSLSSQNSRFKVFPSQKPANQLATNLKRTGPGLYQIGMDTHTGFLVVDSNGEYFCHAGWDVIKKEPLDTATDIINGTTRGMFVGKLLDDEMILDN